MVRRTKEQAQETREQLLDAAEQVFLEKGVARSTLEDIARAAGMTRGAVYWHFANKAEIFSAVCDRAILPMQAMLDRLVDDDGADPLEGLVSDAADILRMVAAPGRTQRVFEILLFKTERCGEVAEVMLREQENARSCRDQLAIVFERAKLRGQLPAHLDARLAAFAASSFLMGAVREWLEWRDHDLAANADWLMRTFYGGLVTAKPAPVLPVA